MSITTRALTTRPFLILSGAIEPLTFTSLADCVEYSVTGIKSTAIRRAALESDECLIICVCSGSDRIDVNRCLLAGCKLPARGKNVAAARASHVNVNAL